MSRLIIVSNRLPVTVKLDADGLQIQQSPGGLATGLSGPHERSGGLWIGWPGATAALSETQQRELDSRLAELRAVPVYLSSEDVESFYNGFANGVLWPLFHYLLDRIPIDSHDWETYRRVNERFAEIVCSHYQPGDLIWVHDYQLALVPQLIRDRIPDATIGFFLHIPFPAAEVFRIFPWREALLQGLLGADLLGFHTLSYVRQFTNTLIHTLGILPDVDQIAWQGRPVRVGAFPMGIDAAHFDAVAREETVAAAIREIRGERPDQRILLGIDRLDYTKGIPRRLRAIERFLEQEPSWRERIRFIQVAVPSRTDVPEYERFTAEVNGLVGRINGTYGTSKSVPIHYLYQGFAHAELVAMYRAADVMLVTPLRDGMNLVAKEFVASRIDDDGVLVLSEFAGAASEMGEALVVNPYDIDSVASTIGRALTMSVPERRIRMHALRARVGRYDVHRWVETFLQELRRAGEPAQPQGLRWSTTSELQEVAETVRKAPKAVLCLDYDGTLVPFASRPELALPDQALRDLLLALTRDGRFSVHVISGRGRELLEEWLGDLPVGLHAEHGLWSRRQGGEWHAIQNIDTGWKPKVRDILEQFVTRVPGSFIEEKTASLAWHYRMADAEVGAWQAKELQLHLAHALSNVPVEILLGSHVIEVQPHGVNKGVVMARLHAENPGALFVACGDDQTDENLFNALPTDGISILVGTRPSRAAFRLPNVAAVRRLLRAVLS
jgi:trehalose 6-phosphate synthase/phosphatase